MFSTPPFRSLKPVIPPASLTGAHLQTFEEIFRYPASHNLNWPDVFAMFSELGDLSVEANGHMKIVHHGYILILPSPAAPEITSFEDLLKLRRFLILSEPPLSASEQANVLEQENRHLTKSQLDAKDRL